MILLEIGNTRWKLAALLEQELNFIEHGEGLDNLLRRLTDYQGQQLLFASVASDELNQQLQQGLTQLGMVFVQTQTEAAASGVINAYADYQRLGVDRWLTLLAARQRKHALTAIVDVGTAVTFDLLNSDGHHLGGWIAPGLNTMQDSLVARSQRITARIDAPAEVLGRSTEDGLYLGCQAAVQGFVKQAQVKTNEVSDLPVDWLFTGGGMHYLNTNGFINYEIRPHLVLEGLAVVAADLG
ncbi:hypothetical protein CWE09_13380 [Aliidiomarina minuta]|uniref:Type III pantothenate kinase n=1 Tax=Aliidiomarina minuta TaxID=880057 RepID=A0A432W118_9GAMM|nr:type III pantothenate kinase [Aliidiomarina minuta]RUO22920.1 hypothetical protein CWE09_13380 [Aliidiomarina minuta]